MARLPSGVRKRKNGILEKRITINGKRFSIYGNKVEEIYEKEQKLKKSIEAGIYTENRNITLDAYFDEWIKMKRHNTKANTLKTYSSYYKNHISKVLGKRKIQQLERREILLLQSKLTMELAVSTANICMKTLKIILNDAISDDIIYRSPAAGIKAIKEVGTKATETYHRALTLEEQKMFMSEAESEFYYEFLAFLLCSGMRSGEVAALTWKDIDYKNNVIHITKTLTYTEDGVLIVGNTTKTDAGNRDIPLTATLKAILVRWKNKTSNVLSMSGSIFVTRNDGLIYSHSINRAISNVIDRLEHKGYHIEHFTAHAFRDTYATRYIEQGGNMQTLKVLLGHSSLAMTMDVYSHVLPNTKQKETESLSFDIAL